VVEELAGTKEVEPTGMTPQTAVEPEVGEEIARTARS
jgi:hypothetical protein